MFINIPEFLKKSWPPPNIIKDILRTSEHCQRFMKNIKCSSVRHQIMVLHVSSLIFSAVPWTILVEIIFHNSYQWLLNKHSGLVASNACWNCPVSMWMMFLIHRHPPSLATTCPRTRQKHVLPANQNSKSWQSNFKVYLPTLEHFGATPQTFEGKQSRSVMCSMGILCLEFWKSERMKLLFFIWMRTQLHKKNTDSHFATQQVQTLRFCSWHFLILQRWLVFPTAKSASFTLAELSSSSFLLAFALSHLDFSCFFSLMNLSHGLSDLCLSVGELRNVAHFLALLVFGTLYSEGLSPSWWPFFHAGDFQIWFRALLVTAVLTLFDASLLFTLGCSYRKIMFIRLVFCGF